MTARSPVEFTDINNRRVGNQVVLANDSDQALLTDTLSGALVTLDWEHHKVHTGETFSVSYKSPDNSPLADNGTIIFAITTSTKEAHFISSAAAGGDAEVEILEGTTFTGGTGTAMTAYNKNRSSVNTPISTVRRDVTITGDGTLIFNKFLPGGVGGVAQGVSSETRDEWELKPSTVYAVRLTNRAGNAQPASLAIEWYEEDED